MNEQQDQSLPTNPEAAFHTHLLQQGRRRDRRSGIVILLCSLALLVGSAVPLANALFTHTAFTLPQHIMWWGILLSGVLSLIVAVTELRSSTKQITIEEVGNVRQHARTELMRRAQGYIPWSYRRSAMVIEAAFACFWILLAISFLYLPIVSPPWFNTLFAILFLLSAIIFLIDACVTRPRQAKRLAAQSAQELAHRLTLGESTEGQPSNEE